jgi:outer membrane protein OmpA-like peptidoglycan-associated protein
VRRHSFIVIVTFIATACGGSASEDGSQSESSAPAQRDSEETAGGEEEPAEGEFQLRSSSDADQARGERPSEIEATETDAAMRLFVVTAEDVAIPGVVIKMTAPDGSTYFTDETDRRGYAEVLVPVDQRYEMEYLSLGRRNTMASVEVPPGPRQDIRLTMRYRGWQPPPADPDAAPGLRLEGVTFESGSATILEDSFPRLDRVVEYMEHKASARIRISGHTDDVGNPRQNQRLSEARAQAVRQYLISKGIAGDRIEAVGYGDERPLTSNDSEEGRARNRRIEAVEL